MTLKIIVLWCFMRCTLAISRHPVLLIVSYDAFRYDFINATNTPLMFKLREEGAYSEYLNNVFPTKTFPNHHSMATGLYAEVHGVIGNKAYDSITKEVLSVKDYGLFHYNEDVKPIWRLNEDAGDDRYSGVMMWPGGSFPYQGRNVTYLYGFDRAIDYYKRVDTVMSWIKNPVKPANLVMMYIEEPDTSGHMYGPNSDKVKHIVHTLDNVTQYLKDQLEVCGLTEHVNVIHLSDHGLSTVSPPRLINLTELLDQSIYKVVADTPSMQYFPLKGYEEIIYNRLQNLSHSLGSFKVYKKNDIPNRWHYKSNPRIPPIYVVAEDGYGFEDLAGYVAEYSSTYGIKVTNTTEFGAHGYDNRNSNMKPFFLARGPKIRRNHKVDPFNTVDLLSLFCTILEISIPANNGSFESVASILISNSGKTVHSTTVTIVGSLLLVVLLVSLAAIITLLLVKYQQKLTTVAALNKRFPQNFHHSSVEAQHLLEPEDT